MRIAYDISPLTRTRRGVWRYTHELLSAAAGALPEGSIRPVSDRPFDRASLPSNDRLGESIPTARPRSRTLWMAVAVAPAVAKSCDVLHCTSFYAPLRPSVPTIVNVYDLTLLEHRMHPPGRTIKAALLLRRSIEGAAAVVTPSETVRQHMVDRLGVDPRRVHVVPGAPSAAFRPLDDASDRVRRIFDLEPGYLLFVGPDEQRKRFADLVSAQRLLADRGHELQIVRVGSAADGRGARRLRPNRPAVRDLGYVADEQLAALMGASLAVVMTSVHEGFGLPVVEALACGATVVAADSPVVREVGRAGVRRFRPASAPALADAIIEVLNGRGGNPSSSHATGRAGPYDWDASAQQLLEVYEAVAAHRRERV